MIVSEVINVRDAIARLEAQQKNLWHDAGISLQIAMERGDDQPLNVVELDRLLDSHRAASRTSSTKSSQ
jgi:hypothetical protein